MIILSYKVAYIGNLVEAAEYIYYEDEFDLLYLICEEEKLTDELFTFSIIRGINLIRITNNNELIDSLKEIKSRVDFFIMCSFGKKIPVDYFRDIEIYNIHYSMLPYYKGRHPTYWATINNEKYVGISVHKVTNAIDSGDIISQRKIPYYIWMNENDLFKKLSELIKELLKDLLLYKKNNNFILLENKEGNYYPPIQEKDKIIDLKNDNFTLIFNKVRSQSKYKGAKIQLENKSIWIKDILFTDKPKNNKLFYEENGCIYIFVRDNIWIKSNNYIIEKEG